MKIDGCGIYAEQLKQIYLTILAKSSEKGETQAKNI